MPSITNRFCEISVLTIGFLQCILVLIAYSGLWLTYPAAASTHIILAAVVLLHIRLHSCRNQESIAEASCITFFSLFFVVAPALQLLSTGFILVNTVSATNSDVAIANFSTICFLLGYLWARYGYGNSPVVSSQLGETSLTSTPIWLFAVVVCISVLGLNEAAARAGIGPLEVAVQNISPSDLVIKKVFFFLPAAFCLTFLQNSMQRNKSVLLIIAMIAATVAMLFVQNPLLEKRNSLGPIYFSLAYILLAKRLTANSSLLLFVMAPVVIFLPVFAMFTHVSFANWLDGAEFSFESIIYAHFLTINYDAWANTVASVQMVDGDSFLWGRQLVGDFFFYVPRDWWPEKPMPTGVEIGQFLIDYYAGWFTNLSAPIVAEAYIDFGILGCVAYGGALAFLINKLERVRAVPLHPAMRAWIIYLSFFLIFGLRGSLMVAFAYGVANSLAFYIIYLSIKVNRMVRI